MNSFEKILSSQFVQILILFFILWFLFLKEKFNNIPNEQISCERCIKLTFDKNISENDCKKKCSELDGQYKKENNNKYCLNYKGIINSNYRCDCDI
jgi:hypothetical protein